MVPLVTGLLIALAGQVAQPIGHGFSASFPNTPQAVANPYPERVDSVKAFRFHKDGLTLTAFTGDIAPTDHSMDDHEDWQLSCIMDLCGLNWDTLIEEEETVVQGWPALKVTAKKDDGTFESIYDLKVDQLDVRVVATYSESETSAARQFLSSLQIPRVLKQGNVSSVDFQLKEYPLGDSGISAKFPKKPEQPKPDDQAAELLLASYNNMETRVKSSFVTYEATYVDRTFSVQYLKLPSDWRSKEPEDKLLQEAAKFLNNLSKETKINVVLGTIGNDRAAWCDVTDRRLVFSRMVITVHGNLLIAANVIGPKLFLHSPAYDEFLHSLKFSN